VSVIELRPQDPGVWHVPTLAEWLFEEGAHRRWIVPELVPAESLILVSGQQKLAKKTWFSDALALAISTGVVIGGLKTECAGPVLYCQEEGSHAGTRERLFGLCRTYDIDPKSLQKTYYAFHNRVKLDTELWSERLLRAVEAWHPVLVIFDNLSYMHLGDENSSADMNVVADTIHNLRAAGASIMFLAHLDKVRGARPKADIDSQVRGSSLIVNFYDVHLALRRYRESEAHINLTARYREDEERIYTISWDIVKNGERVERAELTFTAQSSSSREVLLDRCLGATLAGKLYSMRELRSAWGIGAGPAQWVREELLRSRDLVQTSAGMFHRR
jgi:RecA-family ATPase